MHEHQPLARARAGHVEQAPALGFEVALLLLIDPILSPVWAWWVHGEVPGGWSLLGGALVLLVAALKTWSNTRAVPG